jgi:hypothetical protein
VAWWCSVPRPIQTRDAISTRLGEIAGWQTARRDDKKVASELHHTREIDRVSSLSEAAFFDELFEYLRELGAWPLLSQLDPANRKTELYPFIQFVLFTIMRCVGGVQSMLATHELLLTDEALMGVLGFNAAQVQHGCTARGASRRIEPVEIRGPFSYDTVADNLVKLGPEKLSAMFNGLIHCLSAQGIFPKQIDAILDATDNEATPSYQTDDGRDVPHVTRDKRPDVRANRHAKKVEVTVFGWKVWIVWEATTKIPLALHIDGINVSDNEHAFEVLQQAVANVAGHSTIRSVALDRGFLDGKLLWAIEHKLGLRIFIPGKSNMTITREARRIARLAAEAATQGKTLDGCVYRERQQTVTQGAGKNATTKTFSTIVVGIRELPADFWNEQGSNSASNSKSFQPKLLRATVVLQWDGAPKDAEKEVVLLTNDPADDPFKAFDAYDDRSLIENGCNREAKEHWFLEHHPKRSEAGMRVHTHFVFFCMALVAAFRLHKAKTDEAERRGQDTGIARYRRKLEMDNRDKVVVFIGEHFAILKNWEMLLLLGVPVRERTVMGESAETVLRRYGAELPEPGS